MRTLIIAEAGVNHNGSVDRAIELIDAAAEAKADVVKFQTFNARSLVSRHAKKAEYQTKNTGDSKSQLEMIQNLVLSQDDHHRLKRHCELRGIEFLSTAFDADSMEFLIGQCGLKRMKIPSGELTNLPLVLRCARSGLPIILSTGMATLEEIRRALQTIAFGYLSPKEPPSLQAFERVGSSPESRAILKEKVTLLHCTTEYPAPMDSINLKAMSRMGAEFGIEIGYSDHTLGITVPIAAVALGATVIEKHFTLDRRLPGPDHVASLEPRELAEMVRAIREVETAISGSGLKHPNPTEAKNAAIARKSLVARIRIAPGDKFTAENLTTKRPGNGISPMHYWDYLGRTAHRAYEEDDLIEEGPR